MVCLGIPVWRSASVTPSTSAIPAASAFCRAVYLRRVDILLTLRREARLARLGRAVRVEPLKAVGHDLTARGDLLVFDKVILAVLERHDDRGAGHHFSSGVYSNCSDPTWPSSHSWE